MVGGVFSAMLFTLFVIPSLYVMWQWQAEVKREGVQGLEEGVRGENGR